MARRHDRAPKVMVSREKVYEGSFHLHKEGRRASEVFFKIVPCMFYIKKEESRTTTDYSIEA
jgi:hypothetical protein